MNFALNDDQWAIQAMASAFAVERLAPDSAEGDQTRRFPVEALREVEDAK